MHRISGVIILILLSMGGILFFLTPKSSISLTEKRKLASLPEITWQNYRSGSLARGINTYINDHFVFRSNALILASWIRSNFGFTLKNQEIIFLSNRTISNVAELADSTASDSLSSGKINGEEAYSGSMLILNGRVYTLNTGNPAVSPKFSKMLNEYAKNLEGHTRVISCVPPLSSGFIPDQKYDNYYKSNKHTLNSMRNALSPSVGFCDILSEMYNYKNEQLWFGSDHHWTALGAYYGYVAFTKAAGFDAVPLSEMTKSIRYPFLGTLYDLTRDGSVSDRPDTVLVYKPKVKTKALRYNSNDLLKPIRSSVFCNNESYYAFLCGDYPLIKITTNVKNGRKAAIIKNSMGNAFSVYLISHYEELYVIDYRYSKHNLFELIKDNNINDLIFAVSLYAASSYGTIQSMRNLAWQNNNATILTQNQHSTPFNDSISLPLPVVIATKSETVSADTLKSNNYPE